MPKRKPVAHQGQLIDDHEARGGDAPFNPAPNDLIAWIDMHVDRIEAEKQKLWEKQMELGTLRARVRGDTYKPYPESTPDKDPVLVTLIIPPECQHMGMEPMLECTD
jgi:hypothetical protein